MSYENREHRTQVVTRARPISDPKTIDSKKAIIMSRVNNHINIFSSWGDE